MVEQSLVDELKAKLSVGAAASEADDVLKSFELIKQIAEEVDYLKGDLDESDYTCQFVFSDVKENYWIKISKGSVEYDKGKLDNPSFTLTSSKDVGLGLLYGELDANIITPLGKLGFTGNYTELRLFQELYEDAIEEFKKRYS